MNQPAASLKKLYREVTSLHVANTDAARKVTGNVVQIGIYLHQIKEIVGHGKFAEAMAEHCPDLTDRTCRNYMRLAQEVAIERQAQLLLAAESHDGKTETVSVLGETNFSVARSIPAEVRARAVKVVDDLSWRDLPFRDRDLVQHVSGKQISEAFREYGVIRQPKPKQHHPIKPMTPDEVVAAERESAELMCGEWLRLTRVLMLGEAPPLLLAPPGLRRELEDERVRLGKYLAGIKTKPTRR